MVIPDIYLNAGGVTVSYFEWIKNLSHMRFGRMGKRFEESMSRHIVNAIETTTGKKLSDESLERLSRSADEAALVKSGLEETMSEAYCDIRETMLKYRSEMDLRVAAFKIAIDKIALSYMELGVFP
jgi:glutamate dehydrogenase (NAD(P)+)